MENEPRLQLFPNSQGKYCCPPSGEVYKLFERMTPLPRYKSMKGENPFSKENWNAFFLARKHYHLGHLNYLSCCMLLKYFSIIPYPDIHLTFFKCLWRPTPGDWNLLLKGQRVNMLSFESQDAKITEIM